jgi:FG-GAP-like repeat/Secretion system C-terminal sorting domain
LFSGIGQRFKTQEMKFTGIAVVFVLLFACNTGLVAQAVFFQRDSSIKVFANGTQKTLAWCGGFNNSQFTIGDLNHDGLQDLVIFDQWLGIRTFLNNGTAGNPNYIYAPHYAQNFPPVIDYLILADYNCDSVPDLFHQGNSGFEVYTGYYNSFNELCFNFYQDLYLNNDSVAHGWENAYNNPGDVPAIVDVDHDGDLDFLTFEPGGQTVYWYRNMRVEMGYPCDSIVVHLEDHCWGKMRQAFWEEHILDNPCSEAGLRLPRIGHNPEPKTTHCCNNLCLFDFDMDGDFDYIDGNQQWSNMTFLQNGRIPMNPSGVDTFVAQDTSWPSASVPVNILDWPSAFNIDINQDGKKDMLVAPNTNSENYKCIWYYKNETVPGSPNWVFQSDTFLVDKSIDMGSGAYPALFDYNKDGKPDLFIGSDGFFQSSGILKSRITCYQNTSAPGSPSFTLLANDFMHLDTANFRGAAPAFGDIDNDGKTDMLLGHTDGTVSYYKNVAASDSVPPVWQLAQLSLSDTSGNPINVYSHAAPFIYDVDTDGRKDLVIGCYSGYFYYYRNVSTTPGTAALQFITNHLGKIRVDPNTTNNGYSTPFIGKIDSTGIPYLVSGSNSGLLYQLGGIASGDTTALYSIINDQYSYVDTQFLQYRHQGTVLAAFGGLRSSLTIGDIAGDGSLEMIVGNIRGGLELYKLKIYDKSAVPTVTFETPQIALYPNPSNKVLHLKWTGNGTETAIVNVTGADGKIFHSVAVYGKSGSAQIATDQLPDGIYLLLFETTAGKYYRKFVVAK